jgi:hypothetical protein
MAGYRPSLVGPNAAPSGHPTTDVRRKESLCFFSGNESLKARVGFSLAQVAERGERGQLPFTGPCCPMLPLVNGVAGHADEPTIARCGESQALALRGNALRLEPDTFGIGFGYLGQDILVRLPFEAHNISLQLRGLAFELGNVPASLRCRLAQAPCLVSRLPAGKSQDFLSKYDRYVRHLFSPYVFVSNLRMAIICILAFMITECDPT